MNAAALIEEYLTTNGPTRSGELVEHLRARLKQSKDAAKKAVTRARPPVKRLSGVRFEHGETFYYLEPQLGRAVFVERLSRALRETASLGGLALQGIEARGGVIEERAFGIVSGAPTVRRKKTMSADTLLGLLATNKLVKREEGPDGQTLVALPGREWTRAFRAQAVTEAVALEALRVWARNLAFGSKNMIQVRGDASLPRVSGFDFDLATPCYLGPLQRWPKGARKPHPGSFAADLILGRQVSRADAAPFLRKCDALRNQRSGAPLLGMLVGESFHEDALLEIRGRGLIAAQIDTLWGKDAATLLRSLLNALENAAAATVKDGERHSELFSRIAKAYGKLQQMRGPLMEHIVGHLFAKDGYGIDMGEIAKTPEGLETDLDVKAVGRGEIVIAECKGLAPGAKLSVDELKDWLDRRVPRARAWLEAGKHSKHVTKPFRFELHFSGAFDDDALAYLRAQKALRKNVVFEWRDGAYVRRRLQELGALGTLKTFDEYFADPA